MEQYGPIATYINIKRNVTHIENKLRTELKILLLITAMLGSL